MIFKLNIIISFSRYKKIAPLHIAGKGALNNNKKLTE